MRSRVMMEIRRYLIAMKSTPSADPKPCPRRWHPGSRYTDISDAQAASTNQRGRSYARGARAAGWHSVMWNPWIRRQIGSTAPSKLSLRCANRRHAKVPGAAEANAADGKPVLRTPAFVAAGQIHQAELTIFPATLPIRSDSMRCIERLRFGPGRFIGGIPSRGAKRVPNTLDRYRRSEPQIRSAPLVMHLAPTKLAKRLRLPWAHGQAQAQRLALIHG